MVSKRISKTSSNEQIFKESIPIYEEALKKSGFHEKLEYVRKEVDKHGREKKKRRKWKIIWFNPPYSDNVKCNVGKQFLRLVRRHFKKGHKLNKIFNKNTLQVSYSCMRNMSSILTELISNCRHQNKYTFSKYDTKHWRQLYCKKPLYCNFLLVNHIWLKIVG